MVQSLFLYLQVITFFTQNSDPKDKTVLILSAQAKTLPMLS